MTKENKVQAKGSCSTIEEDVGVLANDKLTIKVRFRISFLIIYVFSNMSLESIR